MFQGRGNVKSRDRKTHFKKVEAWFHPARLAVVSDPLFLRAFQMGCFRTSVRKIGDPRWPRFVICRTDRLYWSGTEWEIWRRAMIFADEQEAKTEWQKARFGLLEYDNDDPPFN